MSKYHRFFITCLFGLASCDLFLPPEEQGATETPADKQGETPMAITATPVCADCAYTLSTPCDFGAKNPTGLLITTTDYNTGSVSVADFRNAETSVTTDIRTGSTDGVPFYHKGKVYIVHRFSQNYIDVIDITNEPTPLGVWDITVDGVDNPNPQAIAIGANGFGFVTVYGHAEVQVLDLSQTGAKAKIGATDLSSFADADGIPEANIAFSCGDTIFVGIQRLDRNSAWWDRVDVDKLVAINATTFAAYPTPIDLLGARAHQVRRDPTDPKGHTALVLTSGIERVDLQTGEVTWAINESVFKAAGITSHFQNLSFDIDANGTFAYIAITRSDYSAVDIWRANLTDGSGLTVLIEGVNAKEHTLTLVGNTLWFGDTTVGAEGLVAYDVTQKLPLTKKGPFDTGLAPYSIVAIE